MSIVFPRPLPQYDVRDEAEFRAALELYLRTLVTGSAGGVYAVTFVGPQSGNTTITTPGAGVAQWNDRWRTYVNLTGFTTAELVITVMTAGAAGSTARVQYTTDLTGASGWTALDAGTGPSCTSASTGVKNSGAVVLTAAARAPILIRPVTAGGDSVASPAFGVTRVDFR